MRRADLLAGMTRSVVLLAFTSLFAHISSVMLYPVLPLLQTEALHVPATVKVPLLAEISLRLAEAVITESE